MDGWTKKRRGAADIWVHPRVLCAVVDRRGVGWFNPNITFNGEGFETVELAKAAALKWAEGYEKTPKGWKKK